MDKIAFVLLAAAALPAWAQQRPDPRVEQTLNQTLIVAMERSVSPAKRIPPVQLARPAVPEPHFKRVDDGLYIDRRLLPPSGDSADDPSAVRIYRRDKR
jgi:hypothetical protein